jgi:Carboxypeptidase regulatory-like domain/TonB-dependent Receptor Plug Domain
LRQIGSGGSTLKWVFTLALMFSYCPLYAQRITASLGGTVHDQSGGAVPQATVKVTNSATNASIQLATDASGHFLAPALTPGPYTVSIEAKGFKRLDRSGLVLDVDQSAQLELTLEVGQSTESVEITGAEPLLETQNAEVGQVINEKSIENLPLNQRNPFSLILLAPGVTGSVGTGFTGLQINVNGGRSGTTDVLLDGVPSAPPTDDFKALTIFPSVDAVQEFKVQTSGYSAEFGLSGGGIINVIYKSGTNDLHGSAYDFLRNSVLDSNSFFSNRQGVPLASFKRNQFGGSVGGPVILPKLYNGRNRTFFFTDYEGLRQEAAASLLTTVPTAAERGGNFSQDTTSAGKLITIYDPTTTTQVNGVYSRQPFPGNIIPTSRFDPVAGNVLKYIPLPNTTGTNGTQINNFYAASTAPYTINQYDIKFDQIISDRQRMAIRFSKRDPTTEPAIYFPASISIAQNAATNKQNGIGGSFDYTFSKSPTFLTEFRYGVSRVVYSVATNADGFNPTQLGFPSYLASTANALTFPGFEINGYAGLGDGSQLALGTLGLMSQSWSLANTKVFSRHTLRFGVEARALTNNVDQEGRSTGDFTFSTAYTSGPNPASASSTSGDGFASFLVGLGTGTVTHNFKIIDTTSQYVAGYFQDDWKASNKLTLNVGVRYDLFLPRLERHDRETYFDPNIASPVGAAAGLPNLMGGLQYVGANGNSRHQNLTYYKNFAPRVGFAYQALPHLVMRGGFGIFYQDSPNEAAATVNQTGYRTDSSWTASLDGYTPLNYLSNPFPGGSFLPVSGSSLGAATSLGTGISAPLRPSPTPYSENWNMEFQYQLPRNWLITAAYVASRGVDLTYTGNLNQLPVSDLSLGSQLLTQVANPFYGVITTPNSPLAAKTVQLRYLLARYPQFTGVGIVNAEGAISFYNSVQLRLEKRFSQNATLLISFTGSKFMDDASSNNTSNFNGSGTSQDANNLRGDYSLSTADVPKRFVASFVYALPFGKHQRFGANWNRYTEAALGGWQLNGIVTAQSGTPLALSASNVANLFGPGERPNSNGQNAGLSGSVESRLNEYFNIADFSQPATYTLGNVSRTLPNLRNPSLQNVDISLFKTFKVTEKLALEFRAESFNAFNTPIFSGPNTSVTSASFGVITGQANTPRQNQFALKLIW